MYRDLTNEEGLLGYSILFTLHYISLHYITLPYLTLPYLTLHYITLHYITLHYVLLYYGIYLWGESLCLTAAGRVLLGLLCGRGFTGFEIQIVNRDWICDVFRASDPQTPHSGPGTEANGRLPQGWVCSITAGPITNLPGL